MNNRAHVLNPEERSLAASLALKKISHVEGYRLNVFDDCTFHQVARIVMSDGASFDLRNQFVTLRLPDGLTEDVGMLTLTPSKGDIWLPEGIAVTKLPIGETIRHVAVIDDEDVLSRNGLPAVTIAFTQAVVFELDAGMLVFDKGDWTDDYIHVRQGPNLDSLLTECCEPWIDDDGWSDEYYRRIGWQ